jgi:hypothetical protein
MKRINHQEAYSLDGACTNSQGGTQHARAARSGFGPPRNCPHESPRPTCVRFSRVRG